MDLINI